MIRQPPILFLGPPNARLGFAAGDVVQLDVAADASPQALAAAARRALGTRRIGPVVLAVPSAWCLTGRVATAGLPRANRRRALAYRLEEQLPVSAEDLAVDARPIDAGHAFAVATEIGRLAPIVAALEAADVPIGPIVPAALLALTAARAGRREAADVVVLAGHAVDVIELAGDAVSAWHVLPRSADDLGAYLSAIAGRRGQRGRPPRVEAAGDVAGLLGDGTPAGAIEVVDEASPDELALRADRSAGGLLFDLRRDRLRPADPIRRLRWPLALAAAAAALLVATVCGVSVVRGGQYARVAADARREQAALYRALFPGQPVPAAVRARLASEARRLAATRGDAALPPPPATLPLLRDVLANLPEEPAFQIDELDVAGPSARVLGRVRREADAAALAEALRGAALAVDPPDVRPLPDGGTAFSLTVTSDAAAVADAGGGQ